MTEKEHKEDKAVRQFVLYCHAALKYEKLNYYNERRHRLEREGEGVSRPCICGSDKL